VLAAPWAALAVAAAAIEAYMNPFARNGSLIAQCLAALSLVAVLLPSQTQSAVLPDDRADALYHSYDGGGVQVDGPSLLVRKKILKNFSVSGNYYVDSISSASIDVLTTASPYKENRTQTSLGLDFLHGKTNVSANYTNSDESDYNASTFSFGVSQDMFGDLTTLAMGFSRGSDEVRRNGDANFSGELDRWSYRLGLTQVLTKDMIANLSLEVITDEGFLNNPYRSVRYLDSESASGYSFQSEAYPNTRTSTAIAARTRYFLPFRAALHGEYRYFEDTWNIQAHTGELGYTHPIKDAWTLDIKFRYYTQTAASFYADLYPSASYQNFLARDKELSTFTSNTFRLGVSYEFARTGWHWIKKGSLNAAVDHIVFDYADFRDITQGGAPGTEPLYNFSADVLQLFVSIWF